MQQKKILWKKAEITIWEKLLLTQRTVVNGDEKKKVRNARQDTVFITNHYIGMDLLTVILLIGVLVLGGICLQQQREIRRMRRVLVRLIKENVKHKYTCTDGNTRECTQKT